MDLILHVIPAGLVAIPACLFFLRPEFRRGGRTLRAGPIWAAAWGALFAAGLAFGLADGLRFWTFVGRVGDTLFPLLLLAGAYSFADRPIPRWLAPLGALMFVSEFAFLAALPKATAATINSLIEAPLQGLAAAIVWRGSPRVRAGFAERALAISFGAIAAMEIGDLFVLARFGESGVIVGWLALALGTGFLQVLVFAERSRAREQRLRIHRRLLQRVATPLLAGGGVRDSLTRIAAILAEARLFSAFGVWKLSTDGARFDVLEGAAIGPYPESLAHPSADLPMLRAALETREPIFVDPRSDPRVQPAVRALGLRNGFVAPLCGGERCFGVIGGLFSGEPDDDDRALVRDLADEIGLVLATASLRETIEQRTAQLAEQTSVLRATVECVPVGIVMSDSQLRTVLVNPALMEQIGLGEPAAWIGRSVLDLFAAVSSQLEPTSRQRIDDLIDRAPTHPIEAIEIRLAQPERRVLVLHTEPVLSADGRDIGRVTMSRDVTSERQVSERMQHAERMQTLGTLAGGLAHDFNNQLTAILGNARLVLDKLAPDDPSREPLIDIERSAEHCGELTHGLLSFARQTPASHEAIECGAAIREVETLLRPTFGPNVELRTRIDSGTPAIAADASQLRRVLVNLVVNARDAVRGRGSVEIWASPAPARAGQPTAVEIGVRDDGAGMDDATRRHIFDPFFTTKELGHGTGLGLSVVYGIVAAHGGEIEVESTPGSGSIFRLRWPAAGSSSPGRRPLPRQIVPAARRATVLVAEDEPSVRRVICSALERAGFRVLEASDGAAAVALHAEHPGAIGIAVLDLSMPHLNGLDAIARIRAVEPGLRCIVMTGHADRATTASRSSEVVWLPKPFGPRELIDAVESVLGVASPS